MTLIDETMPSPPRSPSPSSSSPEHLQLEKINTAVDTTLSDFLSLQQRVLSLLTRIVGLRWYQRACHTKVSYQQWNDMTKQASQLTYAVAGTDEALMRHLFSLDAIMGDDDIRVLRRACVHRIKHAITQVEQYTSYMYKIQYWIKKWIQRKEEDEEDDTRMETEETNSKIVSPSASPAPELQSPSSARTSSPPMRSSTLHPPATKTRSNSLPSHHAPIKTSRSFTSSPVLKGKKGPATQGKTTTTTTSASTSTPASSNLSIKRRKLGSKSPVTKSPTLPAKATSLIVSPVKSAPASPQLPHRHIPPHASKPIAPTSPRFSVSRDPTHITITALLPGVVRDSLDVTVRGHLLRIVGICQGENFVREMELPETCAVDEMDAAWEDQNDTLKIRVPIVKKQPQPQQPTRPQPTRQPTRQQQSRYVQDQDMEDEDGHDVDVSHPYYSHQPLTYPSRCAPSYVRPSYHPSYGRRSVYAAPPRSMFGSSRFGGFW